MRLIQLTCDGDDYFINPDKIKHLRTKEQGLHGQIKNTLITFIDSEEMVVEHTIADIVNAVSALTPVPIRKVRRNV